MQSTENLFMHTSLMSTSVLKKQDSDTQILWCTSMHKNKLWTGDFVRRGAIIDDIWYTSVTKSFNKGCNKARGNTNADRSATM